MLSILVSTGWKCNIIVRTDIYHVVCNTPEFGDLFFSTVVVG